MRRRISHSSPSGKSEDQLFPELVSRLQDAGVQHTYRPSSDDIILTCPICNGKMVLAAHSPFWMCLAERKCRVDDMTFGEVVQAVLRSGRP